MYKLNIRYFLIFLIFLSGCAWISQKDQSLNNISEINHVFEKFKVFDYQGSYNLKIISSNQHDDKDYISDAYKDIIDKFSPILHHPFLSFQKIQPLIKNISYRKINIWSDKGLISEYRKDNSTKWKILLKLFSREQEE